MFGWNLIENNNDVLTELKNQFKHFITLFTLEHINEEPNWEKIDIIHAWGSPSIRGIYYELCVKHNIEYFDFRAAQSLAKSYDKDLSKMFRWMKNINISKNPVIFDVGANIGMYSIFAASINKINVLAFEPESNNFQILMENIIKNNLNYFGDLFTTAETTRTTLLRLELPIP